MITNNIKQYVLAGLVCCGLATVPTACTDTWNDHYESLGEGTNGVHEGTLWQAIKGDANLSNFASVIEACNYVPLLNGSQVFTVFAPTNDQFSAEQAQSLISSYRTQVADAVLQENNTVIKEFLQNHIALYNYSVSSQKTDSIVMMNGKYAVLDNNSINGVSMLSKNQLYGNGVLFTLGKQVDYLPNVFEYFRTDSDMDSVYNFLYNSHYYYRTFMPSLSVPGSIVDGKTQYLDSVFTQDNELFSVLGRINSEDSTYIMVAPTNEVWKQLIEEYEPYFNYYKNVKDRDSMVFTNSRVAILTGTTFSRTYNSEAALQDSARSNNCLKQYSLRKSVYGQPFEYNQYVKPLAANGVMDQTDVVSCSNGQVRKATKWNIDKLMTFNEYVLVQTRIKEYSKVPDSHKDSVATINPVGRFVESDNRNFYDRLWNNYYIEFEPAVNTVNHSVTFILPNVLSNLGYDIYLITAPVLASDTTATKEQRLPTVLRCTLQCPGTKDEVLQVNGSNNIVTNPDIVDYILLAEDHKFEYCTYGVDDENLQNLLKVETRVTNRQLSDRTYTRTMRINGILLVPHGTLELVDALPATVGEPAVAVDPAAQGTPGVLMYPHGKYTDRAYKGWYMQR